VKPEPLPPALEALLDAARPLEHPPAAARRRIALAVALSAASPVATAASIVLAAGAGEAAREAGKAVAKTGLALSPFVKGVGIAAVCFTAGATSGAALHATFTGPVVPASSQPAPAAKVTTAPPRVAPAASIPTVEPDALPPAPSASARTAEPPRSAPPPAASSAIAEEQSLLDRARTLLARGDPEAALAPLATHARRFPAGVLAEEREALSIQALARSGRVHEAEARAARFRREYPSSLMAAAVDDALRETADK
jgi:hypothetical protein